MNLKHKLIAAALLGAFSSMAAAQAVGVSWSNFQEERWKTDEKAIKDQLTKLGGSYVSADAGGSPEKQLADIDGLIAKGAKALIILAMDKDAIIPALAKAKAKNISVIAYDRLIEAPGVFYITFDNKARPPTPTPTSCARASRKCSTPRSRRATSRSSARSTPTAGSPRTRRRTWSRS